jgi:hypothetical protein
MLEVLDLQFKQSIKYGMTYNQFWYDEPQLYYIYQEAYIERMEEQLKLDDIRNWQLAQYIQRAVGSCLSDSCRFPESPMFSAKPDHRPKNVYDMIERFKDMADRVNNNF